MNGKKRRKKKIYHTDTQTKQNKTKNHGLHEFMDTALRKFVS
jgi:hypothetical protein